MGQRGNLFVASSYNISGCGLAIDPHAVVVRLGQRCKRLCGQVGENS
jgi:hypothetical protein